VEVPLLPPTVSSLSFDRLRPNGTHYFVVVEGANFGPPFARPALCTHAGGVVVTINDVPCEELVMLLVRVCSVCVWDWGARRCAPACLELSSLLSHSDWFLCGCFVCACVVAPAAAPPPALHHLAALRRAGGAYPKRQRHCGV
jgi:hypothetical protein